MPKLSKILPPGRIARRFKYHEYFRPSSVLLDSPTVPSYTVGHFFRTNFVSVSIYRVWWGYLSVGIIQDNQCMIVKGLREYKLSVRSNPMPIRSLTIAPDCIFRAG